MEFDKSRRRPGEGTAHVSTVAETQKTNVSTGEETCLHRRMGGRLEDEEVFVLAFLLGASSKWGAKTASRQPAVFSRLWGIVRLAASVLMSTHPQLLPQVPAVPCVHRFLNHSKCLVSCCGHIPTFVHFQDPGRIVLFK